LKRLLLLFRPWRISQLPYNEYRVGSLCHGLCGVYDGVSWIVESLPDGTAVTQKARILPEFSGFRLVRALLHLGGMTLSPGPLNGRVWFGLAAFGWVAFAACGSDESSLFGTNMDPNANDAGSGGEVEPASGGSSAKGGQAAVGGTSSKGGASGVGGRSEGGDAATGGVMTGSGGITGPSKGGSAGAGAKDGCSYAGETYPPGTSFPSEDGCNTCSCMANGTVACTARACAEGGAPGMSCQDELAKELAVVQACESVDDCGVPIKGSSCGCTKDLVANKTADTSRVEELLKSCGLASTCDCPEADGFVCKNGRCGWNYVQRPACTDAPVGRVCIVGNPIGSGDQLMAGVKLQLLARPSGCFSSSCTESVVAGCEISGDGAEFEASAEFCLRDTADQGQACTADCGGGGHATCESEMELSAGNYTLKFGDQTIEFQVPSVIAPDDACIEITQ
jgi:hypothetical protein